MVCKFYIGTIAKIIYDLKSQVNKLNIYECYRMFLLKSGGFDLNTDEFDKIKFILKINYKYNLRNIN